MNGCISFCWLFPLLYFWHLRQLPGGDKMLEWNLYWPMLEAALKDWSCVIPAVYLEIIGPWIDDMMLE